MPWRSLLGSAAGAVDRAVVAALHARGARDRAKATSMSHEERMVALGEIDRAYADELIDDPTQFFVPPPPASLTLREVRPAVFDAQWASASTPYLADVAEKYSANVENRTARARLFFGQKQPRPAVIALHGYMGGHFFLEEAQWPVPWFLRRGLDVAMPVLPFHGARGGARRGAPPFPSADPRLTNEGFRQAVTDVVSLADWLRARGAPKVGVIGMSLGGYTSSLVATVSRAIDFVMPMIPLASIADFAREQGRLGEGAGVAEQHAALERANRVVSPLVRPLLLPSSRALVVAAEHDQITPTAHAQRIATHFGCEMVTIPGGHLVQLGRAAGFRAFAKMLEREGIIPARQRRAT